MTSQPTSGQPAGGPVKWGLAAGLVMLIVLVVAVTAGVLSTGTQNGAPSGQAPPSTDTPGSGEPTVGSTPSASDEPTGQPTASAPASTAAPSLGDFTGVWVGAQGSVLTISAAGTYEATKDDELVDTGSVVPSGSRLLLHSDTGSDGTMSLTSGDAAVVQLQSLAPDTQFTRA